MQVAEKAASRSGTDDDRSDADEDDRSPRDASPAGDDNGSAANEDDGAPKDASPAVDDDGASEDDGAPQDASSAEDDDGSDSNDQLAFLEDLVVQARSMSVGDSKEGGEHLSSKRRLEFSENDEVTKDSLS